jgi:prophage antirepressor-like protein
MDTKITIFEPINEVQNIIGTLVTHIYNNDTYQTYLSTLEGRSEIEKKKAMIIKKTFTDIRVFNSNTNPLFLSRDIGILMGITNISTMIKNYKETERVVGHILVHQNKTKERTFLTRHGVYRAMMNSRTKLSELFREFIYELLDNMVLYEQEKLKKLLEKVSRDNPTLVKESILELNDNAIKYKQLYEIEKHERSIWARKAEEEHEKNEELEQEKSEACAQILYSETCIHQLQIEKKKYLNKIYNISNSISFDDENAEMLDVLKRKFLKEMYIYAATPSYLEKALLSKRPQRLDSSEENKPECGIYLSDNEECEDIATLNNHQLQRHQSSITHYKEEYAYSVKDLKKDPAIIGDRELYYYITLKKKSSEAEKFNFISMEWVEDKNKFGEIIEILKSECATYITISKTKKGSEFLFKSSLDLIKNSADSLILNSIG